MIHRGVQILLFAGAVCAANPHTLPAREEKRPVVRESAVDRFIREAQVNLREGGFGADEKAACERHLREAKGEERLRLSVVLSEYCRRLERDAVAALEVLGETVLTRAKAEEWKRTRAAEEKQAFEKWRIESRKARAENAEIPQKPSGLAVPFPPTGQWTVGWSNIECVLEIARSHIELKCWREALEIADFLGRNHEGISRVLAGECAADAMTGMSRFESAVDLYRFALRGLATLSSSDGSVPAEYPGIRKRIEESLNRAIRQQEIEKYGLGYVLYRDARRKQHGEKAYGEAWLLCEDLVHRFDKTVYGEAGRAYGCQCLLALSEPDAVKKLGESTGKQEDVVKAQETRLARMKQAKAPADALKEVEAGMVREKERLKRLRAVPRGKEAAAQALEKGLNFIKENEFGLYRGETLVDLAGYAFERQLDSTAAERLYRQAWAWLEKVESVDAKLNAYEVPDQARAVSSPPRAEDKVDCFGNADRVALPPEAIVNRRTCGWYLNDLRERCALALGFLEFAGGKPNEAGEWYAKVVALDSKTGFLERKGEWNDYRRLTWGAEHGYLFAHPQELALFKGRQRFAVLMGDFYYCTERFAEAADIYGRLLAGEFGRLSAGALDYPQYAYASCVYWLGGREKAFVEYLKALERKNGTFTEDRAAYCAGKIAGEIPDPAIRAKGMELLARLAGSGRKNDFVYRGMALYGARLIEQGRQGEGVKILRKIPKESGEYYEVAKYYLEKSRMDRKTESPSKGG